MLSPDIFKFLRELNKNNNREWFNENKPRFETIQKSIQDTVTELLVGIHGFDKGLADLNPKDCVFRIYRDVRFSKDKSPYKTNLGAYLVEGGKKSGNAGYYLHLQPGECFVAGGMHMPLGNILKAVRTEIYNFPEDLVKIIQNPDFIGAFGEINGDKLKNVPRGFDKEFEQAELLKFKSYTVSRPIAENVLTSENGLNEVLRDFKIMQPFIAFLNRAVKENI